MFFPLTFKMIFLARTDHTKIDMKLQLLAFILCLLYISEAQGAGSCHYFSAKKMDWFDALFACQKKKLCLANMDSRSSFKEIEKKLTGQYRNEYWFGLNGYEKYSFKYVANERSLAYMPPESQVYLDKPCAFLKPLGDDAFTFETGNCGHPRYFVCSSAVKCNGLETNSTYVPTVSASVPCDMKDDVKEILGLLPQKKVIVK